MNNIRKTVRQIEAFNTGDIFQTKNYFSGENKIGRVSFTTPNEIYVSFEGEKSEVFSPTQLSKSLMAGITKEAYQDIVNDIFLEKAIARLKANPRRYKDVYREVKNKLVYPRKFQAFMVELYKMDLAKKLEVEKGLDLYFIK